MAYLSILLLIAGVNTSVKAVELPVQTLKANGINSFKAEGNLPPALTQGFSFLARQEGILFFNDHGFSIDCINAEEIDIEHTFMSDHLEFPINLAPSNTIDVKKGEVVTIEINVRNIPSKKKCLLESVFEAQWISEK